MVVSGAVYKLYVRIHTEYSNNITYDNGRRSSDDISSRGRRGGDSIGDSIAGNSGRKCGGHAFRGLSCRSRTIQSLEMDILKFILSTYKVRVGMDR